jgi:hypothetical protein
MTSWLKLGKSVLAHSFSILKVLGSMATLHHSFISIPQPLIVTVEAGGQKFLALKCIPSKSEPVYYGLTYDHVGQKLKCVKGKRVGYVVAMHSCDPIDPYAQASITRIVKPVHFLSAYTVMD